MHLSAAAASTPSGVPPMPKRMSVPAPGPAGGDGAGDVPVGDEADPGAGGPHLGDEGVVAGPVQDDGGQVAHRPPQGLGERVQVLGRGAPDVAGALGPGADRQLLHVDARAGVEHGAALGHGDDGQGAAAALGRQGGPVDGVDRDVGRAGASRRRSSRR